MNYATHTPASNEHRTPLPRCHLLFNGLGAGNIGDEAMFAGFCAIFEMAPGSTVEVFDANAPIVCTLPGEYAYITWTDESACDRAIREAELILLVGDTPVSELHGIHWPLLPIGARIRRAIDLGKQVDAVAVGVDHLRDPQARRVFAERYAAIRSWTTRSGDCRRALRDLGVDEARIAVAADLAWVCPTGEAQDHRPFPSDSRPAIAVNIVGEDWAHDRERTLTTASALDDVSRQGDAQIVFVCNETRAGDTFDLEMSRRVAAHMRTGPAVIEARYVSPAEQIALIRRCCAVLSQRYHLGLMGVLAGRPVALFSRGHKLRQLIGDLGAPDIGPHDAPIAGRIVAGAMRLLHEHESILRSQQAARSRLTERVRRNASRFL
ncbi:MAG: polysaccharide pyruvyl transferase family protein [Phycisphaerales bacterium]|nr:polysaccharide pyruvyl transferase family protein [Phycisphaerales bacterium]